MAKQQADKDAARVANEERLKRELEEARRRAEQDASNAVLAAALKTAEEAQKKAEAEHKAYLEHLRQEIAAGHPINIEGRSAKGAVDDSKWHKTYQKFTYYCGKQVGQAGYEVRS